MRGRAKSALASNTSWGVTGGTVSFLRVAIVKYSAWTHAYNSRDCIVQLDEQALFSFANMNTWLNKTNCQTLKI